MRSTGSCTVRRAVAADIPQLVELMREFYAESSYPLDEGWAASALDQLLSTPSLGVVWLVEVGGVAAGHVVLTVHFSMEFGGLCGTVDDLYVRPAHRRQGAATAALEALVEECRRRGCRALTVEVGAGNRPAKNLYAKLGLARDEAGRETLRALLAPG